MFLDKRKQDVLFAVIDEYIASAEPVGSRTLARKHDLGVSPATIRNEMADLEMLGYLEHIHTSSGRIPSAKGYRFYVDGLMEPKPLKDEEKNIVNRWYKERAHRIDEVFKETARLLSKVTGNLSLVLTPETGGAAFRSLQFLPLDERRSVAVILTDVGFVENKIIDMPPGSSFEDFQEMAKVVNQNLAGKNLRTLPKQELRSIREAIGDEDVYASALEVIDRAVNSTKRERLYLGGTTQMLSQPEFRDVDKLKDILLMLEEEELIKDILRSHRGDGLTVTIGQENEESRMENCSIITASYHLGGELLGTLAVMGPTRMEYAKAMSILSYINQNISYVIRKFT